METVEVKLGYPVYLYITYLLNILFYFQITKDNYDLIKRFNNDNKKAMNKLHDNIVGNLQYMDNKTTQHLKISQESTDLMKKMKSELKEDFNNYANKVRNFFF